MDRATVYETVGHRFESCWAQIIRSGACPERAVSLSNRETKGSNHPGRRSLKHVPYRKIMSGIFGKASVSVISIIE